jgi:hypothetical protein
VAEAMEFSKAITTKTNSRLENPDRTIEEEKAEVGVTTKQQGQLERNRPPADGERLSDQTPRLIGLQPMLTRPFCKN